MPLFTYKAQDKNGKIFEDTIQAVSREEARAVLGNQGLDVLIIRRPGGRISFLSGHISTSEKAAFARFLATMLRSGMSLPQSVEIIAEETKNKKMQKVLADISYQTKKGKSLSMVLSVYKDEFDAIFLTMVKAGEESGSLDKSLDYLAKQLASSHELNETIKGSLMYPAVIVLAMIGNGLLMAVFVLPRISGVFLKLELPLPAYTRILLGAGNFFGENVLLVFVGTGVGLLAAVLFLALRPTRSLLISFLSKMPVVKKVIVYIDVARYARTLSTLLKSGVPIVDALDVSADTLTRDDMRRHAKDFGQSVSRGESLSAVMIKNRKLFPGIVIQSVRAGEQSGNLEIVLEEMAGFYEAEVQFGMKRLTGLIEPVLMLVIGVVVGVMVIIMIAPIYSIIGGLQQSIEQ